MKFGFVVGRAIVMSLVVVVHAESQANDAHDAPTSYAQNQVETNFDRIELGSSQAQVESIYGKTARWSLQYENGSAYIVDDKVEALWPQAQPGKPAGLPVEIGMSRSAVESRLGRAPIECAWYEVEGYDHSFCFKAGELNGKARRLPSLRMT